MVPAPSTNRGRTMTQDPSCYVARDSRLKSGAERLLEGGRLGSKYAALGRKRPVTAILRRSSDRLPIMPFQLWCLDRRTRLVSA